MIGFEEMEMKVT